MEEKVNVGTGEDLGVSKDPLFAGFTDDEASNSLNKIIFTARMFSDMEVFSRMWVSRTKLGLRSISSEISSLR